MAKCNPDFTEVLGCRRKCELFVNSCISLLTYSTEYVIIIITGGGETPTGQELDSSRKRGNMYRYTLVYTPKGTKPNEAPPQTVFWCDDRSDAMKTTYEWILPQIIEGKLDTTCGGTWAILCNRNGEVVAWLLGDAAMGFYWEERVKHAYF